MNLLWLGILASVVSSGLYLLRAVGLKRYIKASPPEAAMEYADFSVKPHPFYPRLWLLTLSFAFCVMSAGFAIFEVIAPSATALCFGIVAFFAYDILGASIMTKMTILPTGILFENLKGTTLFFFVENNQIKQIVPTNSGFYIELHKPFLGNRLPFKTLRTEEITEKIIETSGIKIGE